MLKRRLFAANLCMGLALGRAAYAEASDSAFAQEGKPHYTVSVEQLQRSVAQRFPLRYPVPGVMNLDLQVPQLRLLPAQNRLGAEMAVVAAGQVLERSHTGTFEVDFALRYEASDRTIRAYRVRVKRLQFPSLQPRVVDMLNTFAPALAEQSLLEVVLHQLRAQDLALADVMGLRPDSIMVTGQGVEVGFVAKTP